MWLPHVSKYAQRRGGGPSTQQQPFIEPSAGGVEPAVPSVKGGVDPTVNTNTTTNNATRARIEGRCDTEVIEYGAIAPTAWVVDTGASYDSVPQGLAERRGWSRVPRKDPVTITTAHGPTTSDFATITRILGMPEEVRAAVGKRSTAFDGWKTLLERRLLLRVVIGEEPLLCYTGWSSHTLPGATRCPVHRR